jgi:hypothetical protein
MNISTTPQTKTMRAIANMSSTTGLTILVMIGLMIETKEDVLADVVFMDDR